MKLTYQAGIAAFIQFVFMTLLGIPNALVSIITTCHAQNGGSNCATNSLVSVLFFLLTAAWFGAVWLISYGAQEKRSKRLAWLVVLAEFLTLAVALFNSKHDSNPLTLSTSIVDAILAVWVIFLALRIAFSKGGRIRPGQLSKRVRSQTRTRKKR